MRQKRSEFATNNRTTENSTKKRDKTSLKDDYIDFEEIK